MKVATAFLVRLVLLPLGITSICACTAQPEANDYLMLPARFAEEVARDPLVALDALIGESEFFVRYQIDSDTIYSGGSWAGRIAIDDIAERKTQSGPYILPLQYHQLEPWANPPQDPIIAKILGIEDWDALRVRIFESVLPRTAKAGVVLHFYIDDYFLYFDEKGAFQSTVLIEKPADYSIAESYTFRSYSNQGFRYWNNSSMNAVLKIAASCLTPAIRAHTLCHFCT